MASPIFTTHCRTCRLQDNHLTRFTKKRSGGDVEGAHPRTRLQRATRLPPPTCRNARHSQASIA
ncbi:hypothetical protein DVU_0926 [Nitratidesulfovibrio vulgaris str. Hildenborough]|uniref:Uncharacterized protein n=1 Tax=Nitratidesulfovibrio vulgaris (strain ATCC 29579 / DSM 644 / CCUG 34227 / NCIMB 8303 / VKM B-1760 / Hildenborough) TaxID=882 RepID=Q72DK3_NITV2|nr:hypothetical protein DVU_0926 [Nitratidesulfovibrio vulgaris str. Hildenborough]